jgi:hypothetical protein
MARRSGWRVVKIHRPYTAEEVASNQGVAKGTVRRWLKSGLPSLNDRRPCLILGGDLVDFLKGRKAQKQTCKPEECYCFRCKAPRRVALGEAEYKPITPTNGQLIALCAECTTLMHKRVSLVTLEALKGILLVSIKQVGNNISKGEQACLNDT